jgi:hypothetical protein
VDERSQPVDVRARSVGLQQHITRAEDEPTLERNQLTLLAR